MDRKGTHLFLSLLRGAEVVSKFQAMNRRVLTEPKTMLGRPLSLQLSLYGQLSHKLRRGEGKIRYQSVSLVLVIVKNCQKKTKRSTYNSNQARSKPWPTRPPTSNNNSPITKRIRTNESQNASLTLATVEDCRRKQGDGTVGTRAVVS